MVYGMQCDDGRVLNVAEVMCRELVFGQAVADRSEGYWINLANLI